MRRTVKKPTHYTVDQLKTQLELEQSEELFGIDTEMPFQCPRINSFLQDLELLEKHIDRMKELALDNEIQDETQRGIYVEREYNVIVEYFKVLKESFEELRSSCENLRHRGEGWKQLARNMFDKLPLTLQKRFINSKLLKRLY